MKCTRQESGTVKGQSPTLQGPAQRQRCLGMSAAAAEDISAGPHTGSGVRPGQEGRAGAVESWI